jgi:hypothetical protein
MTLNGPIYRSKIHAAIVNDVDTPMPLIPAKLLCLLHTDYMDHERVDEALSELSDQSLITEVS